MNFFFADDSMQKNPSRGGMEKSKLLALGGICVPHEKVGPLETALRTYCQSIGFPDEEKFKWSPDKKEDHFMREKLNHDGRVDFFLHVLNLAKEHSAKAMVVVTDKLHRPGVDHESWLAQMFLERCQLSSYYKKTDAVVFVAKPSGGKTETAKLVSDCLTTIRQGTDYVTFRNIPLGVTIAPSNQMRLLQLADVVTSCTVARIGGEDNYSLRIFPTVCDLFLKDRGRIGGVGLKIDPDNKYVNLYNWIVGDKVYRRAGRSIELPIQGKPYFDSPLEAAGRPPPKPVEVPF